MQILPSLFLAALAVSAVARPDPQGSPLSSFGSGGVVPGGGAWAEVESARESAPPPASCRSAAVAPVDAEDAASGYAVGSLASLASITIPPAGATVADWALRPLFVSPVTADAPPDGATPPAGPPPLDRLCLSRPASPGGAVTVTACGVPGAARGTAINFDVVDAARGGGEGPALMLRAAPYARQALPGGPPVPGVDAAASVASGTGQCLAALGAVVGLAPCGGPETRWRAAPASVPDTDAATPKPSTTRRPAGWTTHPGVMLVNPASGLCAVADGRLAACDAGGDGGRVFRLCSGPGACARFGVPPC